MLSISLQVIFVKSVTKRPTLFSILISSLNIPQLINFFTFRSHLVYISTNYIIISIKKYFISFHNTLLKVGYETTNAILKWLRNDQKSVTKRPKKTATNWIGYETTIIRELLCTCHSPQSSSRGCGCCR